MNIDKPAFLITIDTEGDNLWRRPKEIHTKNSEYLIRFQDLCEKYNFFPTYLTNYEMATNAGFVKFARNLINKNTAEVGMHLHAWNSPPIESLTSNDYQNHPYLIEFPEAVMRSKLQFMTNLLEDTFSQKMISHRAGRWAFDKRYARMLVELGYKIDCSVTPGVSWEKTSGNPSGAGGTDYSRFPDQQYLIDLDDISKPGNSTLLELPMTIMRSIGPRYADFLRPIKGVRRFINKKWPENAWLRPNGFNINSMIQILNKSIALRRPYVEFMLHSSEFMPGGSPNFPHEESIEKLYGDLELLFSSAKDNFRGATLKKYGEDYFNRLEAQRR